jgi:hypothetical protein
MDALHIKPGPMVGKILNELLEKVLDNPELNNYQTLLTLAKEIYAIMERSDESSCHDSIQHQQHYEK